MRTAALLLGMVLAALLVAIGITVVSGQEPDLAEAHREVAAAAEREALAFLDVDYRDMEPRVDAVLGGATGEFAEQYAARRDELVGEARENRSISVPEVVAVGIGALDENSAQVLVAADSLVSNRSTGDERQPHYYRLRLDLVREGDRWLTSGLEVVR